MSSRKQSPNQYVIDFTSRARDEYLQIRNAVLAVVGRDLKAKCLLELVHRFENERSGLVMDYVELSDELLCDRSTVIRLRKKLEELELIDIRTTTNPDGGDGKNEYRLNWEAIRTANMRSIGRQFGAVVKTNPEWQGATGEWQGATGEWQGATALKEYHIGDHIENSGPVPESRAETADGFDSESARAPVGARRQLPDQRAKDFVRDVPVLAEAAQWRLAARPPSDWTGFGHALFGKLTTADLKPLRVIEWHLEQLASSAPVCGGTEADLLLSLAAGAHALAVPECQVKRNRVAIFVITVARGEWRDVLLHVGACRDLLDRLAESRGSYWREPLEVQT